MGWWVRHRTSSSSDQLVKDIGCGFVASLIACTIVYPIDSTKAVFQTSGPSWRLFFFFCFASGGGGGCRAHLRGAAPNWADGTAQPRGRWTAGSLRWPFAKFGEGGRVHSWLVGGCSNINMWGACRLAKTRITPIEIEGT